MDYIFKEDNGALNFIGNFEELYRNEDDPWEQSSSNKNSKMTFYYSRSRDSLLKVFSDVIDKQNYKNINIAEFGCGLGYVTAKLKENFSDFNFYGLDISHSAIEQASKLHSKSIIFQVSDLRHFDPKFEGKFQVILVVNMLWYILENLNEVISNINRYFDSSQAKVLIIQNAYFKENQRYGVDIINGFEGAKKFFIDSISEKFNLESFFTVFHSDKKMQHDDGIIVLCCK